MLIEDSRSYRPRIAKCLTDSGHSVVAPETYALCERAIKKRFDKALIDWDLSGFNDVADHEVDSKNGTALLGLNGTPAQNTIGISVDEDEMQKWSEANLISQSISWKSLVGKDPDLDKELLDLIG